MREDWRNIARIYCEIAEEIPRLVFLDPIEWQKNKEEIILTAKTVLGLTKNLVFTSEGWIERQLQDAFVLFSSDFSREILLISALPDPNLVRSHYNISEDLEL